MGVMVIGVMGVDGNDVGACVPDAKQISAWAEIYMDAPRLESLNTL